MSSSDDWLFSDSGESPPAPPPKRTRRPVIIEGSAEGEVPGQTTPPEVSDTPPPRRKRGVATLASMGNKYHTAKSFVSNKRGHLRTFGKKYTWPIRVVGLALLLVTLTAGYFVLRSGAHQEGATTVAYNVLYFTSLAIALITFLYYRYLRRKSIDKRLPLNRNEIIQAKQPQHWMCFSPHVLLLVAAIIGLIYGWTRDSSKLGIALVAFMTLGFLLVALGPYLIRFIKWSRKKDKWAVRTAIVIVMGVLVMITVFLYNYLEDILRAIGHFLLGVFPLLTATPTRPMEITTIFVICALVRRILIWRINPLVATNLRLFNPQGLFNRSSPSMDLKSITDQNFHNPLNLPWGTARVESAGQDQSITTIRWVPVGFLHRIDTGMSDEPSGKK